MLLIILCCAVKPVTLAAGCKAQSKVQKDKLLMLAFAERVSILRIVAESQGDNFSTLKIRRRGTLSKSLWRNDNGSSCEARISGF